MCLRWPKVLLELLGLMSCKFPKCRYMQNLKCVDLHHACTIIKKDVNLFISPYVPTITTNKALGFNDRNVKLTLACHACTHTCKI